MKDFRMTGKDVSNYNLNMKMINDSMMGAPIPPGMLSMYDLSRPLTSKEVSEICMSARMVNESQGIRNNPSHHNSGPASLTESLIVLGIFLIAIIIRYIDIVEPILSVLLILFVIMMSIISIVTYKKDKNKK